MKNWKDLNRLPVYITMAAMVSACGASTTGSFTGLAASTATSNTSTSSSTTTTTTTDTGSGSSPAYQFAQFGITGSGGTNTTYSTLSTNGGYIDTDNVLQVQVTVAPGGLLAAPSGQYSGFSTNYSCASFNVFIYDDSGAQIGSQTTGLLQVPGQPPCYSSTGVTYPASQILNFASSVASPHGGIEVRVTAAQYDFYCKLWYQYFDEYGYDSPYYSDWSYWCPSKAVYENHTVDASLQVEVNGTSFQ